MKIGNKEKPHRLIKHLKPYRLIKHLKPYRLIKHLKPYRLIKHLKPVPTIFNSELNLKDGPTTHSYKPRNDIIKSFTDFDTLTPSGINLHQIRLPSCLLSNGNKRIERCICVDRDFLSCKIVF